MENKNKIHKNKVIFYLISIGLVTYSLLPIILIFFYSLVPNSYISQNKIIFSLKNYIEILTTMNIKVYFLNSVIVSILSALFNSILSFLAAYAITRLNIPFKNFINNILLLFNVVLVLGVFIIVPIFDIIVKLKLFNTLTGLILIYTSLGLPFSILIFSKFIKELPLEYEEAALIDGFSRFKIIFNIVLPLLKTAFMSIFTIQFIGYWNEFVFALTLTNSELKRTLAVGVTLVSTSTNFEIPWGSIMAASFISLIPLIILVYNFEKFIIKSVSN